MPIKEPVPFVMTTIAAASGVPSPANAVDAAPAPAAASAAQVSSRQHHHHRHADFHPGRLFWTARPDGVHVGTNTPEQDEIDAHATGYFASIAMQPGEKRFEVSLSHRGELVFFALGEATPDSCREMANAAMERERRTQLNGLHTREAAPASPVTT